MNAQHCYRCGDPATEIVGEAHLCPPCAAWLRETARQFLLISTPAPACDDDQEPLQ